MSNLCNMKGFTIIELAVTMTIVSILTALAVNMYSAQERNGRRMDGLNTIIAVSLAEERYRTTNSLYGTLAQAWSGVTASPAGYYTLSISNVSSTSYTISAQAQGNQANDAQNGTSCSTLQLAVSNGTVTKSPSTCWPN
jgi:type IV pilus assembly protein PilE